MSLMRGICLPESDGDKLTRSPTISGEDGFVSTCPHLPSGRSGELDFKLMFELETWYWQLRTTYPVADGILAESSRHSQKMMASFAPLKFRRKKEHLFIQFLSDHPEGLVLVCGDFNPTSTGITELTAKRVTGLTQIIKVLTRDTGTLDWCLTNRSKLMASPKQLPKLGKSDHYSVLIHPAQSPTASKNTKKIIEKWDLRPSRLQEFGQWIAQQSWEDVLSTSLVHDQYNLFINKLATTVDTILPVKSFRISLSDKAWISAKIKALILDRQQCLHKFGKDSARLKKARNAVQRECIKCKKSFYDRKVAKLKQTNIKRWWDEVKG